MELKICNTAFQIYTYDVRGLFIFAILISTLCIMLYDVDYVFGKKKEPPIIFDENLQVELLTAELKFPIGIDFLSKNDILVIEKNTGQVKRIIEGKIVDTVLDLNVASESERGLLGLAILNSLDNTTQIHNTEQNQGKKSNDGVTVFLFYTETKNEDNGEILGNRLYKYDFIEGELINPIMLLDLPFLPGPSHNGGVLDIGPDNNLYLVIGDVNRKADPSYLTFAQNIENEDLFDGRGGVLRITPDGNPVISNDLPLGDSGLLDLYFGYGIRNSFGISFDPLTGFLWETENGSNYGDEINLILPGFNGGWKKVLGPSSEYETFKDKKFDRKDLILFDGKGKYYDPVFTWADTVAPTAITFINSNIFDKEYENDLLVGSVKQGRIFHFNLNETRTGLDLSDDLIDKLANVDEELEPVIFGKNFGTITDIEINPYDGKIYVTDGNSKKGKIYVISPSN